MKTTWVQEEINLDDRMSIGAFFILFDKSEAIPDHIGDVSKVGRNKTLPAIATFTF